MCGISGISWADADLVSRMNFVNRHRGPDDEGFFCDGRATLGHRRLAILDLSQAGHQPMFNEDFSIAVVYNGEIYNSPQIREELLRRGHTFRSRSDTEVILHAYEEYGLEESLRAFNGMWAFCLYDIKRGKLILARDRFGVKPLYYHFEGGRLAFSSMISALKLLKPKWEPNHKAVMRLLAFNLLHCGEETFYEGIKQLPPGSTLEYSLDAGEARASKWYQFMPRSFKGSPEDAVRSLFMDAVKLRTLSDVPVGSCLSGGLDSSSIVCVLDKALDFPFKTFSLTVPGSPLDESAYVNIVAESARIESCFATASADSFVSDVEGFLQAQEEPVSSLSVYAQYKVMELASHNGAKVLLDGQGGDEIFAGYSYYWPYKLRSQLLSLRFGAFANDVSELMKSPDKAFSAGMLAFLLTPDLLKRPVFKNFLSPWLNWGLFRELGAGWDPRWDGMSLDEALRLTLLETAIPHLLVWEDKNSMRWHVETRLPFLDYRLVETAAAIPAEKKLVAGRGKAVFRDAMRGITPDRILDRRDKIGFALPEGPFFENPDANRLCEEAFSSQAFNSRPYWNAAKLKPRLEAALSGHPAAHGLNLFKLLSLELWLSRNF